VNSGAVPPTKLLRFRNKHRAFVADITRDEMMVLVFSLEAHGGRKT